MNVFPYGETLASGRYVKAVAAAAAAAAALTVRLLFRLHRVPAVHGFGGRHLLLCWTHRHSGGPVQTLLPCSTTQYNAVPWAQRCSCYQHNSVRYQRAAELSDVISVMVCVAVLCVDMFVCVCVCVSVCVCVCVFIVYCLLNGSPLADAEAVASLPGVHIGAYNIKHREYIHYQTLYKR